ncbi:phasin family protein [Sulfuritalea hydrogenivorans]|uniref:Poly(Hydroxyalkanoate) granule-associated protein n=1 Tax=Sulfuritalea hydrogenivorans sk43H TaxID=1223802 RepID=W0SGH7_9PROT|nr:poly(hydroxyalkanoate) granule-associated protein [Sulfuritalea hydrogenivorans sk43H]
MYDALIREGEAIQKKTRKVTEDKVTEMAAKATGTWDKLEQVFENRVARSLHSLGVPTKDDVATLGKRVAELKAAVDKLNAGAPKAAKPKSAAAKPVRRAAPKAKAASKTAA